MKQIFERKEVEQDKAASARMDYANQVEQQWGPYLGPLMANKIRSSQLKSNWEDASKMGDIALQGAPREELAAVRGAMYANTRGQDATLAQAERDMASEDPAVVERGRRVIEAHSSATLPKVGYSPANPLTGAPGEPYYQTGPYAGMNPRVIMLKQLLEEAQRPPTSKAK